MTGRAKALPAAGGALLVFLGLLGTLLPVVTAFSLPASLPLLLGAGALLTIYIVTMFSVRRLAWVLLLVLVAAWAFVCLRWQALLRVGAQVTIASVANELALGVNFISEIALPAGASAAEQVTALMATNVFSSRRMSEKLAPRSLLSAKAKTAKAASATKAFTKLQARALPALVNREITVQTSRTA